MKNSKACPICKGSGKSDRTKEDLGKNLDCVVCRVLGILLDGMPYRTTQLEPGALDEVTWTELEEEE